MRIVSELLLEKIRNDQGYKLLMSPSSCEDARLAKESAAFEKWIAREHRRERDASRRERHLCH